MSNVAETSRLAYYSLDNQALLESVRGRIIREISRINREIGPAYISQIAFNLGLDKSNVSGRLNELKYGENAKQNNPEMKIKPFQVNGEWFKVKHAGQHRMPDPKNPVIYRMVDTWAIVRSDPPAPEPVQTSLPL